MLVHGHGVMEGASTLARYCSYTPPGHAVLLWKHGGAGGGDCARVPWTPGLSRGRQEKPRTLSVRAKKKDKKKETVEPRAAKVVPISELKKVHKVPLGQVAQACLTDVAYLAKEQVENVGDGRAEKVIHDMRVALRRLRSAVDGFKPILDLPEDARRPGITRVLKVLGTLRDADVMQETLRDAQAAAGSISAQEHAALDQVLAAMNTQREEAIVNTAEILKSRSTKQLLKAVEDWVERPRFKKGQEKLVARSTGSVAPALVTPRVAAVLLHPAWAIQEIRVRESQGQGSGHKGGGAPPIAALDRQECATMHELRKRMRELRYMMELLGPVYRHAKPYKRHLSHLVKMQSLLGTLQDLEVLTTFLGEQLGPQFSEAVPKVAAAMASQHRDAWADWLAAREALLDTEGRAALYKAVLYPDSSDSSSAYEALNEAAAEVESPPLVESSEAAGNGRSRAASEQVEKEPDSSLSVSVTAVHEQRVGGS